MENQENTVQDTAQSTPKLVICTSTSGTEDPPGKFYAEGEFKKEWIYLNLGGKLSLKCPSSIDGEAEQEYELKLKTIEYDKKVFSPCQMALSFSVTRPLHPSSSLGKLLKSEYLSMECELFVPGKKKREEDTVYPKLEIAQSFFIHSFKINDKGSSMTCVFNCFSMDRKIAVKKGSEAFTGRRFGDKIFKAGLSKCSEMEGRYDFSCNNLLMVGYNGAKGYRDGNREEKQKDGSTVTKFGHNEELIHPYIVRYNETLYDFLARVAHRCGEFLYFEGGELHLGLPEATRMVILKPDDSASTCRTFSPVPICTFPSVSLKEEDVCDEGYSSDYATGRQEVDKTGSYFDMQYTSDDHFYNVKEDDNLGGVSDWWMLLNALGTLFSANNILAGLAQAGLDVVMAVIYAEAVIPDKLGKDYEKYLGDGNAFSSTLSGTSKVDDYSFDPQNLCNSFFHKVEAMEKRSEREMVMMNFSSTYPDLTLCSAVDPRADGSRYVVTRLHGKFSSTGDSSEDCHYAEAVPVLTDAGIDFLPAVAVPPRGKISHSVTSGPLEAIVKKNDDPLRLGRVRILYPWQKSDDDQLSPWLRVPVPFAGNADDGGGLTMTPACEEHVIVDYYGEDIERPYVGGSYYFRYGSDGEDSHSPLKPVLNSVVGMKPTSVPHTISSGKGHYLSFSAAPDSSLISQLVPLVDSILKVCGVDNPALPIKGGGVVLADGSELCKISLSGNQRAVTIQSRWGTVNMSAFTGITVNAPNGDVVIKGKNVTLEAGNNLVLRSGTNIKPKKQPVGDTIASVFGTLITQLGLGSLASATGVDLRGCLDLSLLRCILEIILRPVEGTLTVQSGRNVIFTVGKGAVTIPGSCLSAEDKSPAGRVNSAVKKACSIIDDYFSELDKLFNAVNSVKAEYEEEYRRIDSNDLVDDFKNNKTFNPSQEEFGTDACGATNLFPLDTDKVVPWIAHPNTEQEVETNRHLIDVYYQLQKYYVAYYDSVQKYLKFAETESMKAYMDAKFKLFRRSEKYKVEYDKFPAEYQISLKKTDNKPESLLLNTAFVDVINQKAVLKRSAIVQIILSSGGYVYFVKDSFYEKPGKLSDILNQRGVVAKFEDAGIIEKIITKDETATWNQLLASITTYKAPSEESSSKKFWKSLGGAAAGVFTGSGCDPQTGLWNVISEPLKLVNHSGQAGPRAFSEMTGESSILFSRSEGKTLICQNGPEWDSIENGDGSGIAILARSMDLNLVIHP